MRIIRAQLNGVCAAPFGLWFWGEGNSWEGAAPSDYWSGNIRPEEAEKERKKAVINNLSGTIRAPHPCINLH
ncbi:hypothetical protein BDQ94DRAFT_152337, partial [Aspergillus welwitschiae]